MAQIVDGVAAVAVLLDVKPKLFANQEDNGTMIVNESGSGVTHYRSTPIGLSNQGMDTATRES